jgi:hypothetical protein
VVKQFADNRDGDRQAQGTRRAYNSFISAYLLGKKRIPKELPPYMSMGDETEAIHYAVDAKRIWQKTKCAFDWLKEVPATNKKTSDSR